MLAATTALATECDLDPQKNQCVLVGDRLGCSNPGGGPAPAITPLFPTATPVPIAFWRVYAGEYSYADTACTARKDPITMIFRTVGARAAEHVQHHGSLDEDDPNDPALQFDVGHHQHYYDITRCVEGAVSQASKGDNCGPFCIPPFAPNSRWHIRCNINAASDPAGGTFAACTPHYDHAEPCGHLIQSVFGTTWPGLDPGGSGFDAGRDYLYYLLVTEGHHRFYGAQYWKNDKVMLQCDEMTLSGSNGWVNEIGD